MLSNSSFLLYKVYVQVNQKQPVKRQALTETVFARGNMDKANGSPEQVFHKSLFDPLAEYSRNNQQLKISKM